jgi:hypothetical protein
VEKRDAREEKRSSTESYEPMAWICQPGRETPLCCATPLHRLRNLGYLGYYRPGIGGVKAAEDFVRGVLKPGVGLMKLTSSLARQLAQLVPVGHMRECPKY